VINPLRSRPGLSSNGGWTFLRRLQFSSHHH
jgi:hypothetical protein